MTRKHFFIVGAQRSATTYLSNILDAHPQIEMAFPPKPEPKFFLEEGSEHRVDQYLSKYFGRKNAPLVYGEKSTSYIESKLAAERIKKAFPDALIIINLRNPVHRAISNYWFSASNGIEDQSISVLVDESAQKRPYNNNLSVTPFDYLRRGCYIEYIDNYAEVFPPEQIKLVVQDQLVGKIDSVQDLYKWLGVDTSFVPACLEEKINSAGYSEDKVPSDVITFLNRYFEEPNKQLQEKYGVEIACWKA